jgi:hypothetical protein
MQVAKCLCYSSLSTAMGKPTHLFHQKRKKEKGKQKVVHSRVMNKKIELPNITGSSELEPHV